MVDAITQECKSKFEAHETFFEKSCEIWRNLLTNQYGISNLHLESGFLYDEEAKDYKPTFEFIVLGKKDRENFERFRTDLENSGFNLYDKNLGTIAFSDLDEVVYLMQLMRQAGFSLFHWLLMREPLISRNRPVKVADSNMARRSKT